MGTTLIGADMGDGDIEQADLPSSFGSVMWAAAEQTFLDSPLWSAAPRAVELDLARTRYAWTQPKYSFDEAKAYVRDAGLPDDWLDDKQYNKLELDILSRRKRDELQRAEVFARDPGGMLRGSARLATSFGVALLDPVNIATAFIPVIGEERYAYLLAKQSGALGRAGVRAGVGAVEGTAGAAVIEPLVYAVHDQEMADYTAVDSFANIAFGGIFGAGLHVGGGALLDVARGARVREIDQTIRAVNDSGVTPAPEPRIVDEGPDPFAPKDSATRVRESADLQGELRTLVGEAGWDTVGGRIVRATEDQTSPDFNTVVGRTPWLPRAEWWPGRPGGFNEAETAKIVEKAIAGERLGSAQAEYLDYLVAVADERVKSAAFAPRPDELAEAGFTGTMDDAFEVSLVARAKEIDEDAVETIAKQHEDDDAGFLKAVKEFVDRKDKDANADAGGVDGIEPPPSRAAEAVAAVRQNTRDAMMRAAIAQGASGQPIRVEGLALLDSDRAAGAAQIRADAEAAAKPENSPLADPQSVKEVDERLAELKPEILAQSSAEMEEAERLLADTMATFGDIETLPAEIRAELDAAKAFADEVESMSKAASMMVQCALRHPA